MPYILKIIYKFPLRFLILCKNEAILAEFGNGSGNEDGGDNEGVAVLLIVFVAAEESVGSDRLYGVGDNYVFNVFAHVLDESAFEYEELTLEIIKEGSADESVGADGLDLAVGGEFNVFKRGAVCKRLVADGFNVFVENDLFESGVAFKSGSADRGNVKRKNYLLISALVPDKSGAEHNVVNGVVVEPRSAFESGLVAIVGLAFGGLDGFESGAAFKSKFADVGIAFKYYLFEESAILESALAEFNVALEGDLGESGKAHEGILAEGLYAVFHNDLGNVGKESNGIVVLIIAEREVVDRGDGIFSAVLYADCGNGKDTVFCGTFFNAANAEIAVVERRGRESNTAVGKSYCAEAESHNDCKSERNDFFAY